MGEETKIQWTEHTQNFWTGCTHVSAGCDNCYMFAGKRRYGQDPELVRRAAPPTFNAPLKWKSGRVFTCSWSDFFITEADAWRDDAWDIIRRTPHLTWQILTKRPALIERRLPKDWGNGWPNVWLGVSVENQQMADNRIPALLKVPAKTRFLSVEPLLGPIDLTLIRSQEDWRRKAIDWVIIGGESGPGARRCEMEWVASIVDQCKSAGVACFNKQLGKNIYFQDKRWPTTDQKGGNIDDFPDDLKIREYPA